ncbi:hypothetical protein [Xanthobacter variabilis]|uniref:hypothetical protein n=1 Tax=Xanthobacter variabilis TaxID=3119932 RepID=UPI00374E2CE1
MSDLDLSKLPQPLRIQSVQPDTTKSLWSRLRDIGIAGAVIGLITTVVAASASSIFQYSRWQAEQSLARTAADFQAATTTFAAISSELARINTLQEILFFTYRDAVTKPNTANAEFLAARGKELFALYEIGRVDLRAKMDSYIFDARRHLDWPSAATTPALLTDKGMDRDPLGYGQLKRSAARGEFDCIREKSMPQSSDGQVFTPSDFKDFSVDWNSSTHHLVVFGYCFRVLNELLEPARIWAAGLDSSGKTPSPMTSEQMDAISTQLDNQVHRLNGFSALGITQVERSRARAKPPGFLSAMLPVVP